MSGQETMIENEYTLAPAAGVDLRKFQRIALIAGIIGLVALVIGFFTTPTQQFLRAYLIGFLFWNGMTLGCWGILMIQYMSGGAWGMMLRRTLEAGTRTWMLSAVLVLPILLGVHELYSWAQPAVVAHDKVIQDKQFYLNVPFFLFRAVLYYLIWGTIITLLNRWSLEQDRTGDLKYAKRLESLSAPGILIYAFTMSFAATDWIMSLTPHWFSTIYGLLLCVDQTLSAMALVVATIVLLSKFEPIASIITKRHLHDMGKLLLAFTMLWAYLSFSQLILIWSGNLPEEITWYIDRLNGGWQYVGAILLIFHFGFPFLMLLSQALKKNPKTIQMIAIYVIFVRIIDVFWLVEPNFSGSHFQLHWLDVVAPIGIGGLWLAYFFRNLSERPILPLNAPDLEKALNHGRHHH